MGLEQSNLTPEDQACMDNVFPRAEEMITSFQSAFKDGRISSEEAEDLGQKYDLDAAGCLSSIGEKMGAIIQNPADMQTLIRSLENHGQTNLATGIRSMVNPDGTITLPTSGVGGIIDLGNLND